MEKLCAIINQGCAGYIYPNSPTKATHIATYGAGPCIAGAFIIEKYSYVGLFHVSTYREASKLITMVYSMHNSLVSFGITDRSIPLKIYLRGGYPGESEDTRDTILNLPYHYSGFEPFIVDESCSLNYSLSGSRSLMVDLDGNISDYIMTGRELFNDCDALSAILSGMTGRINIVCDHYRHNVQCIDIQTSASWQRSSFKIINVFSSGFKIEWITGTHLPCLQICNEVSLGKKSTKKNIKHNVKKSRFLIPKKQKIPKQKKHKIYQPR
ncbi:putative ORFan [Tupanvirus deep ocean]|uniref:ORFan n=2 Tax=Tupanvirus TaxID=2094720 RepID=A0AC62A8I6_9VIRU|nr:putative ORFan [Tupanvirus deep ocean]QKU33963.1 putative ORFan [Tupanvirus deep ocean]